MAINTDRNNRGTGKASIPTNEVPNGAGDAMAIALTGSLENQANMIRGFVGAAELSVDAAAQDFAAYLTRYSSGQRLLERTFEIMAEQPMSPINITSEVQDVDLGIPAPSLGDGLSKFRGLFGGSGDGYSPNNPFRQLAQAQSEAIEAIDE
jgi:hypothetical protein